MNPGVSPSTTPPQPRGQGSSATRPAPQATMADLLQLCGERLAATPLATRLPLELRRLRAGQHLVHEGAPAGALFFVCAGTFKVFRCEHDGYEQVLAFASRGELLGFDALHAPAHAAAIVALEHSAVYALMRHDIARLSELLPPFASALRCAASLTLARSRELAELMAPVASEVRLARFLILHSRRLAEAGQSPHRFLLRMARREIASLLGVAHETVSRSFSTLAALELLTVRDREVELHDLGRLGVMARGTRRQAGAGGDAFTTRSGTPGRGIARGAAEPRPGVIGAI
jgi:CRP/FNR family transcriptional regulator